MANPISPLLTQKEYTCITTLPKQVKIKDPVNVKVAASALCAVGWNGQIDANFMRSGVGNDICLTGYDITFYERDLPEILVSMKASSVLWNANKINDTKNSHNTAKGQLSLTESVLSRNPKKTAVTDLPGIESAIDAKNSQGINAFESSSSLTPSTTNVSSLMTSQKSAIYSSDDLEYILPSMELLQAGWNGLDQNIVKVKGNNDENVILVMGGHWVRCKLHYFSKVQPLVQNLTLVSKEEGALGKSGKQMANATQNKASTDEEIFHITLKLLKTGWNGIDTKSFDFKGVEHPIYADNGITFWYGDFSKIRQIAKALTARKTDLFFLDKKPFQGHSLGIIAELIRNAETLTGITHLAQLLPAIKLFLEGWKGSDDAQVIQSLVIDPFVEGDTSSLGSIHSADYSKIQQIVLALRNQNKDCPIPNNALTNPKFSSTQNDTNKIVVTTTPEKKLDDSKTTLQSTQTGLSPDSICDHNEASLCLTAHQLVAAGWNGEDDSEFRLHGIREPIVKGFGISFKFSDFQKIKLQVQQLLLSTGVI